MVELGAFVTSMLDRTVADLTNTAPSGSRAGYDRSRELFTAVNQRVPGPEPVARMITTALAARRPKLRYTVGLDARFLVPLHTASPLRLSDRIKHAVTGLPRTAPKAPTAAVEAAA
ncbi:hypothetical protein [Streptomyces longwoodensis]|uniref:hypothetical protein n=1 Tax=Streptomyces longwoodensis TaxID=68231 RepID=UPI0033CC84D5